jgi:hypothetical protein
MSHYPELRKIDSPDKIEVQLGNYQLSQRQTQTNAMNMPLQPAIVSMPPSQADKDSSAGTHAPDFTLNALSQARTRSFPQASKELSFVFRHLRSLLQCQDDTASMFSLSCGLLHKNTRGWG